MEFRNSNKNVSTRLPPSTAETLKADFQNADWNKSGCLDAHKMQILLSNLGLTIPNEEVELMIKSVSTSGRIELNLEEFLKLFDMEEVKRLFQQLDTDRNGNLQFQEIKKALHNSGWRVTDHQIQGMIERLDSNGDGKITFQEFYDFFQHVPNLNTNKMYAVWLTPSSKVEKLRCAFDLYDVNHDGFVNVNELNQAFHHLGLCLHDAEVLSIFQRASQGKGSVSFYEFMNLFDITNVRSVFNEIDTNNDGHLDFKEVKMAFKKIGWTLTDLQVHELISLVDQKGDSRVDFEEFLEFFEKLPLLDLHALSHYWISTPFISDYTGSTLIPFLPNQSGSTPANYSIAAALSSMVSRTVTNPLERIKIILQTETSAISTSPMAVARQIIAKEGYIGLWKGTGATNLRLVPFAGVVGAMNGMILDRTPNRDATHWRFFAIASAAAVASTLTYPLDLIRTRMSLLQREGQTQTDKHTHRALINLVKSEGIRGAYRGLGPTLLALPPFIALQQTTFEVLTRHWSKKFGDYGVGTVFGLGIASGVFAQTLLFPMEVVRTRMQIQNNSPLPGSSHNFNYTGTFNSLKTIISTEGKRGLFRGMGTAYLRVAPNAAISLWIRDSVLKYMEGRTLWQGHKHEHHEHLETEPKNSHLHQHHGNHQDSHQNHLHDPHVEKSCKDC